MKKKKNQKTAKPLQGYFCQFTVQKKTQTGHFDKNNVN